MVCTVNPGRGGWQEHSWGPQLALAPTVLEGMIAAPMNVSVSGLLAQQIIVGKLPGMGFKVLAQDPGCQVTVQC